MLAGGDELSGADAARGLMCAVQDEISRFAGFSRSPVHLGCGGDEGYAWGAEIQWYGAVVKCDVG